jgi:hypothetical protein
LIQRESHTAGVKALLRAVEAHGEGSPTPEEPKP